ncbi:flagellar hook protein FlgE [Aliidiomarina haloalkalitolerans]|uniref:Flagellar hook protein FlgE n=1 Tax=Aliidiomarina haloalkalitolerans TaxID=859059 RepID=A0A432VS82_9GAMM|nr:flagellar hook protein FlgE [Aliidiomarina haloalkalitolerans]MCL4410815.1 flagellar hook protein FlgE [Gammaproteobacteria bacterium]RUO19220.1 flagellar hook protein FlgE [Aliidiomarina haloalkalitolerans]
MSFSQALSGLRVSAESLNVVSNNIANARTVGFKSTGIRFADVYSDSRVGLGVRVGGLVQNFNAGNQETTNRNLDLAINGNGFFRLIQNDQTVFSRNGQFSLTKDGFIENAQGARLTGYNRGTAQGTAPEAIRIPADGISAQRTNNVDASFNLDSRAEAIAATGAGNQTFSPDDPNSYSYVSNVSVYDSLGTRHDVRMFFFKHDDNEWSVGFLTDQDQPLDPNAIPVQYDVATQPVEFAADGTIVVPDNGVGIAYNFDPQNGADPVNFALNLTGTTQFANNFEVAALAQDGYTSGSLLRLSVNEQGQIVGTYNNDQQQVLGTLALATFRNNEGLRAIGNNVWVETGNSGAPIVGVPGEAQFGQIASGVVEASNVDLNQELVDLIIAQRNYQANAQSIRTQDEVLQTTVNLR